MASHRSRSVGVVVAVVIAIVAVVAGGAAGLWLGLSRTPDGLAPPPVAEVFPVATSGFDDARQVRLDLETDPGLTLVAHTTGVVTDTACTSGGTIKSGSVPWRINGAPVLALATPSPFYRDFKVGVTGPDVTALQEALARLGIGVEVTGAFDGQTAVAVGELLARSDIDIEVGGGWPLARLVWLPGPTVTTVSCQVVLGGPVGDGAPLAVTAPVVTGLAISPIPTDVVPGDRAITVGGVTVPVGADGTIEGQNALEEILATGAGRAAVETVGTDRPVPLSGTWALAEPVEAATVPASAVAGSAGATCVVDPGGEAHAVTVVDSSLGRSVVRFTGNEVPDAVRVAPGGGVSCD